MTDSSRQEEKENQIQEILDYYKMQKDKQEQEMIVQMLRELQETAGFLSPELKQRAADAAQTELSLIQLLIQRYPSLKESDYQHEILACTGERCGKKEGFAVLEAIRRELGIEKEGLSKDGKILLRTRCCLKQCRTSPNLYIDGKLYAHMTPSKAAALIQSLHSL